MLPSLFIAPLPVRAELSRMPLLDIEPLSLLVPMLPVLPERPVLPEVPEVPFMLPEVPEVPPMAPELPEVPVVPPVLPEVPEPEVPPMVPVLPELVPVLPALLPVLLVPDVEPLPETALSVRVPELVGGVALVLPGVVLVLVPVSAPGVVLDCAHATPPATARHAAATPPISLKDLLIDYSPVSVKNRIPRLWRATVRGECRVLLGQRACLPPPDSSPWWNTLCRRALRDGPAHQEHPMGRSSLLGLEHAATEPAGCDTDSDDPVERHPARRGVDVQHAGTREIGTDRVSSACPDVDGAGVGVGGRLHDDEDPDLAFIDSAVAADLAEPGAPQDDDPEGRGLEGEGDNIPGAHETPPRVRPSQAPVPAPQGIPKP